MAALYSNAFMEQALVKAHSRGQQSIMAVAHDLNLNHHTLRYWMKKKPTRAQRFVPRTGLVQM